MEKQHLYKRDLIIIALPLRLPQKPMSGAVQLKPVYLLGAWAYEAHSKGTPRG